MVILKIEIDKNNRVPIYLQVKEQILYSIKQGILRVGEKMPTERELSQNLGISRNTVSTAYKELEQEGVLKSFQGKGTFVMEDANPWKDQGLKNKIIKFVDLGLEEALELGMEPDDFLDIVIKRVEEKKEMMKKIVAAYVECNVEQSRMFSKQLSESTNMNVNPLTINDLLIMDDKTRTTVKNSQVIISTFNHVNEVTSLIQGMNKEVLGIAINPDLETIVKIARYPQGTRFGFLCISEEFKFKIRGALEKAGLGSIDILYSTTKDEKEIREIVEKSEVLIVSPGRYKEVERNNFEGKDIIMFMYSLDDGSVKALKSKIIDMKYQK